MVTDEPLWYVQKGSRVQGPFTPEEVGRFLLLGRVRNTDRVSRDGELWEPVTQVPELVPEELLDLDSERGWRRLLDARADHDERAAHPPMSSTAVEAARHERPERRDTSVDPLMRLRDDWRERDAARTARDGMPRGRAALLPWSLLGITLGALGVVLWLNASGAPLG